MIRNKYILLNIMAALGLVISFHSFAHFPDDPGALNPPDEFSEDQMGEENSFGDDSFSETRQDPYQDPYTEPYEDTVTEDGSFDTYGTTEEAVPYPDDEDEFAESQRDPYDTYSDEGDQETEPVERDEEFAE